MRADLASGCRSVALTLIAIVLACATPACLRADARTTTAAPPSTPAATSHAASKPDDDGAGAELLGTPALAWTATDWIGSPPLTLAGLRGKVVLVRWFTDTECPFCTASAPALNQLHRDFAARGLVVIGMYHHKRPDPIDPTAVKGWVRDYGFAFPVAIDRDWRTLRRWWLTGPRREFTSVSFLIDRRGIIRRIHKGGSIALGGDDFAGMRATIEQLLAEPGAPARL